MTRQVFERTGRKRSSVLRFSGPYRAFIGEPPALCSNQALFRHMSMKRDHLDTAEEAIRGTGARMTRPRIMVLAVLLAAERALTHTEVESRLPASREVNRVTIYRVLEWLTARGLAHKIAGDDRVWRFNAAGHAHPGPHAHFQCSDCGQVLCLEPVAAKPSSVKLPAGYRQQQVELTVKGLCADCVPARSGIRTQRHSH
jgi:Fur family transcriptional regulator, ferric uptake regulator